MSQVQVMRVLVVLAIVLVEVTKVVVVVLTWVILVLELSEELALLDQLVEVAGQQSRVVRRYQRRLALLQR